MRRPFRGWSNPKYVWRYYFVRRKSPLSGLFWSDILDRAHESVGMYNVELAARDWCDAGIRLSRGGWGENYLELTVYDGENKPVEDMRIRLSYRSMTKVMAGFEQAYAASRRVIREENTAAEGQP